MSLSTLHKMLLIAAIAAASLTAACGNDDGSEPAANEDEIVRQVERYMIQADLQPSDETDVQQKDDENVACDDEACGDAEAEAEAERIDEEASDRHLREIEVAPL